MAVKLENGGAFSMVTQAARCVVSAPMSATLQPQGKKLATARELAARYGVCRRTITNWTQCGRLHSIKLGRRCVRFDVERADAEIARFTVDSVS